MKKKNLKIASLKLDPENARRHGEVDIDAIAYSLNKFGQQTPIVVTADKTVIKGNGTLMAASKLGWNHIEAIQTELTGAQLRAYAIADNQTGLISQWNIERLTEQIQSFEAEAREALQLIQQQAKAPKEHKAPKAKTDTIRIENVSQSQKEAVIRQVMDAIEEFGHAYRPAAY